MVGVGAVFLDTSVLLPGLMDLPRPDPGARRILTAIAEGRLRNAHTAWHCCLEFYSVATRLPEEYRLTATDALLLLEANVLSRLKIHDLPVGHRHDLLRAAATEGLMGGRIYDAHIAEVAHAAGVTVVVTNNRRHFVSLLRHGIRVIDSAEFSRT